MDAIPEYLVEQRFGRYRVVRPLGSGAMGTVYLARDELLEREVAVKTLRSMGVTGFAAEAFRQRFTNEARAVAALSHPNAVRVFDMGFEGETPYLVMEVVSGPSLGDRLAQGGRLSAAEAQTIGVQVARALEAAHRQGILHRDVKPANILEGAGPTWKLADFGVARLPDSSLTLTGQFLGSPAYAAPECLNEGAFSPASDVYALGATLYEAVTGEPCAGGRGLASVAARLNREDPRPVLELRPDLPREIAGAIMRALARHPAARPTASQLADELAAGPSRAPRLSPATSAWHAPGSRRRRASWLAAALAGTLLLGLAIGVSGAGGEGSSSPTEPARAGKHERRWRKVQERLSRGDLAAAEHELVKLLDKHPEDVEAQDLLRRLRSAPRFGNDDR